MQETSRVARFAKTVVREPLLHFAMLGALLFALHARVARPPPDRIEVTAAFVEALRAERKDRTGREPSAEELRGLVRQYVEEEVLYREALALGLDRGDVIVRRRLAQKMEMLASAQVREPSEADIAAYLEGHVDRYRAAQAISFQHVFVEPDRHDSDAAGLAAELLAALRAGAEPGTLGDPFVAGAAFARRTRGDLDAAFGGAFAEGAFAAPIGQWSGPIRSSYGLHLVRVSARVGGQIPDLAAVRSRVREDLLEERRRAAVREQASRLSARYRVEIEWPR